MKVIQRPVSAIRCILADVIPAKRALRLVLEWLDLHQAELLEDWNLVQAGRPANKIAPLE
ncbi:MAG: DUF4160 domain-containing protein [Candidatus Methylomirabilis sp.]|nr:DUF4160 domain-containing protein [Candidatus Methylomirabilis sp.]